MENVTQTFINPNQIASERPPVIQQVVEPEVIEAEPDVIARAEAADAQGEPAPEAEAPAEGAAEASEATPEAPAEEPEAKARDAWKAITKRERELVVREREMKAAQDRLLQIEHQIAETKKNPLKVLEYLGITYEDLTDYIINDGNPSESTKVKQLERQVQEKISAYERMQQEAAQRAQQAQIEAQIQNFKNQIVQTVGANTDSFELIQAKGEYDLVYDVIEAHFNETNQLMSIEDAAKRVERHLEDEAEKILKTKKFQSRSSKGTSLVAPLKTDTRANVSSKTLTNNKVAGPTPVARQPRSRDESLKTAAKLLRWNDDTK